MCGFHYPCVLFLFIWMTYNTVLSYRRSRWEERKRHDSWLDIHLPNGKELCPRLVLCEQRGLIRPALKTTVHTGIEISVETETPFRTAWLSFSIDLASWPLGRDSCSAGGIKPQSFSVRRGRRRGSSKVSQHLRTSLLIPSRLCNRKQSPWPAPGSPLWALMPGVEHWGTRWRNDSKSMKESAMNMEGECMKKKWV